MEQLPTFEEMERLARENPDELEKMKRRMVDEVIENAPEKNKSRLRGLQFQIDAKIKTSKTQEQAVERIYDQMLDSFFELDEHLQKLKKGCEDLEKNKKSIENEQKRAKLNLVVKKNKNKDNS